MDSSIAALLTEHFSELEDPRAGRAKRHELINVIVSRPFVVDTIHSIHNFGSG